MPQRTRTCWVGCRAESMCRTRPTERSTRSPRSWRSTWASGCATRHSGICRLRSEIWNLWFFLQILLNLQMLYDRLGSDLSKWMRTVAELRKSRTIFDTQVWFFYRLGVILSSDRSKWHNIWECRNEFLPIPDPKSCTIFSKKLNRV